MYTKDGKDETLRGVTNVILATGADPVDELTEKYQRQLDTNIPMALCFHQRRQKGVAGIGIAWHGE